MSWFLFSLICLLGWGCADLFYKKGTDENDPGSHLKIAVWVGLVMGVCALCLLPFSETLGKGGFRPLLEAAVGYAPASLCYIVSMVIGYAGLRYLELSIVSPVQNASGAFSSLIMFMWFTMTGRITSFVEAFTPADIAGTLLIVAGVVMLAIVEQRLSDTCKASPAGDRKYRHGALALLFPLLYCLFDTVGTAADGVILSESSALGELDVLVLYGLTFLIAGLIAWIWLLIKNKRVYNPFARSERPKAIAAVCEEFGQVFYVFAMASRPMLAAPMVASYCIVSVLLSRFFADEKLDRLQYACIIPVLAGIVILGISEGLSA